MVIFLKKYLITILLASILLVGCSNNNYQVHKKISLTAGFDTFVDIQIAIKTEEEFNTKYEKLITQYKKMNDLFDIYHTYPNLNNLKTINDNAGKSPVEVDQTIIDMLLLCKDFYEITNHEFDITMGPVLKVWHNYRTDGIDKNTNGEYGDIPTEDELTKAKACTGWENVEIDDENNTVYLTKDCASLDVGGVAKGYTAEYLANMMENDKVKMGVVNAGGNNRTINSKLDGSPWKALIQDPEGKEDFLAVQSQGSISFVTSGDYQRYYVAKDGNKYSHIIDPFTLYPATHYRSVTIICKNSAIADILSTTLYTLPYEEGLNVLAKVQEKYPDDTFDAVWLVDINQPVNTDNCIDTDRFHILYTDGIKENLIYNK